MTMNLMPSDEQVAIATATATFLAGQLPMTRVRELIASADPVDAGAWVAAAELGWFGLGLAESDGGIGYGLAEEAMLFREIGRSLAPGPFLATVLATRVAALGGAPELASRLLAGDARAGLVLGDVDGPVRVLDAVGAELLLVVSVFGASLHAAADVRGAVDEPCLDDASRLASGTLSGTPLAAVDGASVWQRGLVLSGAMLVGIAERCLQLSVDHASSREQFGQPIGVHQGIKHPIADMAVRAEAAWPEVLVAAVASDEGRADARFHALSARITAAEAAEANATRTVQTMGGMGFTFEHDAHLLVKRALVLRSTFGGDHELLAALLAEPAAI
jgi:alkylation response protein AidB-like acyl-CoA dehydrogenase